MTRPIALSLCTHHVTDWLVVRQTQPLQAIHARTARQAQPGSDLHRGNHSALIEHFQPRRQPLLDQVLLDGAMAQGVMPKLRLGVGV